MDAGQTPIRDTMPSNEETRTACDAHRALAETRRAGDAEQAEQVFRHPVAEVSELALVTLG